MAGKAPGRKRNPAVVEAVFVLAVLALIVGGGLVGFFVGKESRSTSTATPAPVTAPAGHTGQGLPSGAFGDRAKGKAPLRLEALRRLSLLQRPGRHRRAGARLHARPPLGARDRMSGDIWNHVPMMLDHFKDENIPFPTFTEAEMADLIAFLHSPAKSSAG